MGADQHIDWQAAASALEWWREAGVDVEVEEAPRDWLARAVEAPVVEAPPGELATPDIRSWPTSLPSFEAWRIGEDAPERAWSKRLIGASGDAASGLTVIVDMPEREDTDRMLLGAAGKLFDRMLAAIGRSRETIYLLPFAAARPIGGRVPDPVCETLAELTRHHLSLAKPERVLILGNAASRALLGADAAPARSGLRTLHHKEGEVQAIASLAPRLLLERPERKADAWRDLQLLIGGWGK